MTAKRDRELGLDRAITRRDFVYGSAVLAAGAMAGCRPGDSTDSAGEAGRGHQNGTGAAGEGRRAVEALLD